MQAAVKANIDLPNRLKDELYKLARKYRKKGLKLFIFGSFANENNRPESDLDLGVLWFEKRNARIFTQLYKDVQDLPTVRKIDLVDMEQVEAEFKNKAVSEGNMLVEY